MVASSAVIISFSLVLLMIYDLDRPGNQLFEVSQSAMIALRDSISVR